MWLAHCGDLKLQLEIRRQVVTALFAPLRISMTRVEQTSLFAPRIGDTVQGNMSVAKLLGKRTHQMPGKLNVSELFFEVPKDYSHPQNGSLRLFARSAERFEKPVDATKKEVKQPPWCTHYPI